MTQSTTPTSPSGHQGLDVQATRVPVTSAGDDGWSFKVRQPLMGTPLERELFEQYAADNGLPIPADYADAAAEGMGWFACFRAGRASVLAPASAESPTTKTSATLPSPGTLGYVCDKGNPTEARGAPHFLWTRDRHFSSTALSGKWCFNRFANDIDDMWQKVSAAVTAGRFPAALVSSASQAATHGGSYVICLFVNNYQDLADVNDAREFLRGLGVSEVIGFKRDVETVRNVYGTPDEFIYRS